ncbi:MAG: ABC transporter ATP-binding protein [Lentisphaeria bacterium]|nr:ABC transporter ATP-binding protein [Lentisphaeria bacterium]
MKNTTENMLEVAGLKRSYRLGNNVLHVLRGVDLILKTGEWCCVFGASGSGKTTFLNLVGALEKPDGGTIRIAGEDISGLGRRTAARFRARRIGFVFQNYQLLPELSILENVTLAARFGGASIPEAGRRAKELLAAVGLADRLRHRPNELSGGEQQRAAIARALVNSPDLLLADEPTGNLDSKTGEEVIRLFGKLRADDPTLTILMITHNRDLAAFADKTVELVDGRLK